MRTTHPRNRWLSAGSAVTAVLLMSTACGGAMGSGESADSPIKIGLIASLTGGSALYGEPVKNTAQFAVDRINAEGGVLGRNVELVVADDASAPASGRQAAQRLVVRDQVDVIISASNSGIRDGFLPVVEQSGIPFLYTSLYEGGLCGENLFSLGEVPPQYSPVYADLVKNRGIENFYFVGNDYLWPQELLPTATTSIEDAGGQMVGSQLVPFGTTDYSPVIDKIKASGADAIVVPLVGADYGAFLKQWRQSGLAASTKLISLTMTDEFLATLGDEADGVYAVFGYYSGLQSPSNKDFVSDYESAYPDGPAQDTLTELTYDGIQAFAAAAEGAGSTDAEKVNDSLEGLELTDSPRGTTTIDPATHHASQNMFLLQAKDGTYEEIASFEAIPAGAQCGEN